MLLYHSKKPQAVDDMLSNNANNIALSICQDKNLYAADRTIGAAVLGAMATREDLHETILRTKSAGKACPVALLDVALNEDNHLQLRMHSAKALAKLTTQKDMANLAMHNMQQTLPWALLAHLLSAAKLDAGLKGHFALFLRNVLDKVCPRVKPRDCTC